MVDKQIHPEWFTEYTLSLNTDPGAISDQIIAVPKRDQTSLAEPSEDTADSRAVAENRSDWKTTAYATTKLAINLVKESSDVFPPLKSVVGGLSAILNHCEVRPTSPGLYRPRCSQPS